MADDGWPSRNFDEIVQKLNGVQAAVAHDLSSRYKSMGAEVSQACSAIQEARNRLNDDRFWSGEGPSAAHSTVDSFYKTVADPDSGLPALADKISQTLDQDGDVLTQAHNVPQSHSRPNSKATLEEWNKATEELRADAQRLYTSPLDVRRPKVSDVGKTTSPGSLPVDPGAGGGGGSSGGAGGGGGSGSPQSPSGTDGLASKDTKPQLAGGDGQQGGAGQGQGGGQGAGSGGGAAGGGQGSGSSGLGSGLGSGGKDSATGLPIGSTTAAGYSPSATGTGPGGGPGAGVASGGLSGLRGGGLPGGAAAGGSPGGVNPAGVGAAGVRGIGGPMGMMGSAGAHGKGGKSEHDDEHATPELLKNLDNSEEWLGERRTFIPGGVLGDFKAAEDADKQALEAEKRRFKSIGWNVKFSDEDDNT
ncbi:Uncharacterised protein [Mycobacteroides abscessus subsp. abscessus]|uniref:WXG100 family type VII secretion target n=1 Tax=Mycobacteroides abscessus subsp. massiliense TaxID=1962118 RepID=A0A1T8KTM7_9MYCO|nr:hypothetical protein [Mycobacteroides abscessus]MEC4903175.1 hypothetical protein [Mycobacteroides chelonae]EHM21837.1 hypothetical protein MMAS_01780 [Mycobacteroides abscessus subsp. massiliense CCUG 48898 = JCM 15300]EIV69091.1 hypothetical protein MMCCUG48898_0028 [Mycobacteroides abscessus subsp. massiliense CCUG 48898 = JCM 15300]ORA88334.1 hypothetical protein BST32_17480 [Mycobacteroides abscessus subsp. massiliense]SIE12653.1 Uncharacterised protein [Mycobacteroides abscessus subsp